MSAARSFATEIQPGDVLSPSAANSYLGCSAKYYFKKIERIPDPPSGALTQGNAVHAAIGENMAQKCETKRDLSAAGVQSIYLDAWDRLVAGQGPARAGQPALPTEFREDEEPEQLRREGLDLALKFLDEACPEIDPWAVEQPVVGNIAGVLVRGYIDLLETNGRIRDLKTAKRTPSGITDAYRFQIATYSQLFPHASGEAAVDTLVKNKTPKLVQLSFKTEASDIAQTQAMYPLVQRSIRAGHFVPNRNSTMCGRRYCAFWRACENLWGGKVND